jgi:hypothetical protein
MTDIAVLRVDIHYVLRLGVSEASIKVIDEGEWLVPANDVVISNGSHNEYLVRTSYLRRRLYRHAREACPFALHCPLSRRLLWVYDARSGCTI